MLNFFFFCFFFFLQVSASKPVKKFKPKQEYTESKLINSNCFRFKKHVKFSLLSLRAADQWHSKCHLAASKLVQHHTKDCVLR